MRLLHSIPVSIVGTLADVLTCSDNLREDCQAYVFGDVIERKTAEKARLTEARLVVSTADTQPVNEHMVSFTDRVDVVVRAKDRTSARELLDKGALYVGVSDLLAADRLEEQFEALLDGEYDRDALRKEPLGTLGAHDGVPYRSPSERVDE
jgi:monovalent cation:H+ antiporter-2, CPA2 family